MNFQFMYKKYELFLGNSLLTDYRYFKTKNKYFPIC